MSTQTRKRSLTPQERQLVEEMQRVRYGCIEHIFIRDGLPEFDDATISLPDFRIRGTSGPHPALELDDMVLKNEVVVLLNQFRDIEHGIVRSLKVVDELPVGFTLEQRPGGRANLAVGSPFLPDRPPVGGIAVNRNEWGR